MDSGLIDAATLFGAGGMGYVALSRFRSLAGVHLIDLQATKLTCSKKAFAELKRLKKKNGLPDDMVCNVLPPSLRAVANEEKRKKKKVAVTAENLGCSVQQAPAPVFVPDNFLPLLNDCATCYANAVTQCLLQSDVFMRRIGGCTHLTTCTPVGFIRTM